MSEFITKKMYQGSVEIKFYPQSHRYYIGKTRPPSVTGILSIIDKPQLLQWAVDVGMEYIDENLPLIQGDDDVEKLKKVLAEARLAHRNIKEEASTLGKKAHEWCQKYILSTMKKCEFPEMPEEKEVQIAVNGFMDWVKNEKIRFISTEKVVYSLKHGYIGTLDIEAMIRNRRHLVDLKTSNGLYNTVRLQTAGYVKADQEESGLHYQGRWAVRLAKETEKEYLARMEKKGKTDFTPYQAFEAKYLDEDKNALERDFEAFIHAKNLYEWNKENDFYAQKK